MRLPRFTLRDLFWLVALAAMGCAWWVDRERSRKALQAVSAESERRANQLEVERGSRAKSSLQRTYALDGYCPVTVFEEEKWKLGDIRYSVTNGNQVFLLAGSAERELFRRNPDRYTPVFDGNDIVLEVESGKTSRGKRAHGIVHNDQIFLFATEASLHRFLDNPDPFIARIGELKSKLTYARAQP